MRYQSFGFTRLRSTNCSCSYRISRVEIFIFIHFGDFGNTLLLSTLVGDLEELFMKLLEQWPHLNIVQIKIHQRKKNTVDSKN